MGNNELEITVEEKLNLLADMRLMYIEKENAFKKETEDLSSGIKQLEEEIKAVVLKRGETIKTDCISAIWTKGKETWDGKLLAGYALAHPDILAAKKIGEPTVSFRMARK